jgi:energy-coupling factor transport system permease protein
MGCWRASQSTASVQGCFASLQVIVRLKASSLSPASWWGLGVALAICAGTASSIWTIAAIIAFAILTILTARENAPWSRSLRFYLFTAALVIAIRVGFRIVFNYDSPSDFALDLPPVTVLFGPLGELHLLGRVSSLTLTSALRDGLRMAAIILSIGLANSLANPRRLLKSTPSALYEVATAFVIALNLAPQLIASAKRIQLSDQLRSTTKKKGGGLRLLPSILEDALESSMALAASMDARGFGRQGALSKSQLQVARLSSFFAVIAFAIGSYLLLTTDLTWVTLLTFCSGLVALVVSLKISSLANLRTRYVVQPWLVRDTIVTCGSATLITLFVTGVIQ